MPELSDRDLLRQVTNGHAEAFNEIVRRYQEKVFNAVLRHVGNYNDACDVVQHVFLNAYRKIGEFKEESNLGTWLYRIAFNQSVTFFRDRKRKHAVSMSVEGSDGEVSLEPRDEADPSDATHRRELQARIQEALQTLDDESRQIVILREFEDLAYDEIAAVLQVPIGTVRSKLHRARLALKEKLADWEGKKGAKA